MATASSSQIQLAQNVFLFTSDDLPNVKSRMIGYAFDGFNFYLGNCKPGRLPPTTTGAFINILTDDNLIIIQQDSACSFGVFYYQRDNFLPFQIILYICLINCVPGAN